MSVALEFSMYIKPSLCTDWQADQSAPPIRDERPLGLNISSEARLAHSITRMRLVSPLPTPLPLARTCPSTALLDPFSTPLAGHYRCPDIERCRHFQLPRIKTRFLCDMMHSYAPCLIYVRNDAFIFITMTKAQSYASWLIRVPSICEKEFVQRLSSGQGQGRRMGKVNGKCN